MSTASCIIASGARNTSDTACKPHDSGLFSRPKLPVMGIPIAHGYGQDGQNGNAWRMAVSMFLTPCPPIGRRKSMSGFQPHTGAKPCLKANPPPAPPRAQAHHCAIQQRHPTNALSPATARHRSRPPRAHRPHLSLIYNALQKPCSLRFGASSTVRSKQPLAGQALRHGDCKTFAGVLAMNKPPRRDDRRRRREQKRIPNRVLKGVTHG